VAQICEVHFFCRNCLLLCLASWNWPGRGDGKRCKMARNTLVRGAVLSVGQKNTLTIPESRSKDASYAEYAHGGFVKNTAVDVRRFLCYDLRPCPIRISVLNHKRMNGNPFLVHLTSRTPRLRLLGHTLAQTSYCVTRACTQLQSLTTGDPELKACSGCLI
jgi:hypothetical protein